MPIDTRTSECPRIVIVGAGITGLCAARDLAARPQLERLDFNGSFLRSARSDIDFCPVSQLVGEHQQQQRLLASQYARRVNREDRVPGASVHEGMELALA